jgi:UDP-glucose 4-epimerase
VEWRAADVGLSDLRPTLEGADAVVHLAWAIQPSHDETTLWRTNVLGSRRLFEAAAAAGIRTIVHASSVGAYAPAPSGTTVDESWPVDGHPTSFYSRHKATVEWLLRSFQNKHPDIRVVSMRPSLIFKRDAATGVRRLFLGPLVPARLIRQSALLRIPDVGLNFQATHSNDVATAFLEAIHRPVSGPFNITAAPILTIPDVAAILDTETFRLPLGALRAGAKLSWTMRLQPTPPGWLDMAASAPTMSSARATRELGWNPRHTSNEALTELVEGLASNSDHPTPPLSRKTSGLLRHRELSGAAYHHDP